jgi:hypothetical protein
VAVFVPTYDKLNESRDYEQTIWGFFSDRNQTERYLLANQDVGGEGFIGRGDAIIVPARETLSNPVRAAFGVGIGNASLSALGPSFSGRFNYLYEPFLLHGFARMILEVGFLGFGLLMAVYWLIFQDARVVARKLSETKSTLAAAWTGITVIMALTLFYNKIEGSSAMTFLFWYFSGLVAAERVRLTLTRESTGRVPTQERIPTTTNAPAFRFPTRG